jgi:alanyl-tRNA synthetase
MQPHKQRFLQPDRSRLGSLQPCIRTKDLELVGDGTHLTYFQMVGNFSFGNWDFELSIELWHSILRELSLPVTSVHIHPERPEHRYPWERRGYEVLLDPDCVWSDGSIGGYCCEIYVGDLEVGNLVNTLGHSTDVGFGLERLYLVLEEKRRVDETSLFRQGIHPILSDHLRTLELLWENGIPPGNKGRSYICRKLLRRSLRLLEGERGLVFDDWLEEERLLRDKKLGTARRVFRRYRDRPPEFWWGTYGILPEELDLIRG